MKSKVDLPEAPGAVSETTRTVKATPHTPAITGSREPPRPPKAFNEHLAASLRRQWKRYRKKLKLCQRKFSETAVHASRVETRRLLSLVDLVGCFFSERHLKKARRALKRHLDKFDKLRDTHVQLLLLAKLLPSFRGLQPFQTRLRRRERKQVRKAARNVQRTRTARLGRWVDAIEKELEATSGGVVRRQRDWTAAVRAVNQAFARVLELRRRIDPADPVTIHRTRVAFKYFRYMVEALAPLLPGVRPEQLQAMHAYQTLLGDIQDIEVLLAGFEKFRQREKIAPPLARKFRTDLLRRRRRLVDACLTKPEKLGAFWPISPDGSEPPFTAALETA